jgi:glycosyltransferase involved in cell wall biosynthesis
LTLLKELKMKLTVNMIVKNEESCLARCLESVRGADELVITDTGSVDRTKEIAAEFGATLYDFPWIDDFSAARNFSLSKCTGDWVFIIDADWTLAPGGVDKLRKAAENAAAGVKTINVNIETPSGTHKYKQPLLFRRCPEVYWKGAIHNYLSVHEDNPSDIVIYPGYSEAHKKDPDRTLRILTKELEKNPALSREKYYLAREYWYRKDYTTAVEWYEKYLVNAHWMPERADAHLTLARCYWQLRKGEEARRQCLQAISNNANFKEALLFMAEISWPKNAARWREFAEHATNEDVLFMRDPQPKPAEYYDAAYSASRDMSRYELLLKEAALWSRGRVLDVCCGTGELSKYIDDYQGIDFSKEAIKDNPKLRYGDVFSEKLEGYDTYVILEALEHLDDLALLNLIPEKSHVVFSVPSFTCPSHVRTYSEDIVRSRFEGVLTIDRILRFNWTGRRWDPTHLDTPSYILLVNAQRCGV